jgi:hypothetical protein
MHAHPPNVYVDWLAQLAACLTQQRGGAMRLAGWATAYAIGFRLASAHTCPHVPPNHHTPPLTQAPSLSGVGVEAQLRTANNALMRTREWNRRRSVRTPCVVLFVAPTILYGWC